jgi:hypothetical protein
MMGETKNKLLTKQMREQMLTPQTPAERYGLGFKIIAQTDDLNVVGHSGAMAGYRADLKFNLISKWGVAVIATSRYNPPIPELLGNLVKPAGRPMKTKLSHQRSEHSTKFSQMRTRISLAALKEATGFELANSLLNKSIEQVTLR